MTGTGLHFEAVRRTFASTVAVECLHLDVEPGEVVGLVGRNGAGKSTTLRLALGLLHPDAGEIRVEGLDPVRAGLRVRRIAGLLAEEAALYPWMTVEETLWLAARLHPRWEQETAVRLRRRLDLDPESEVGTLSRGTRARLSLALVAACRPRVLLLDDPTASLDPLARRQVLEGILDVVVSEGGAVLYASHLVQDIERITDRVVVLDEGKIVLEGDLERLKQEVRSIEAVFPGSIPRHVATPATLHERREGRVLRLISRADPDETARLLREAGAEHVQLDHLPLEEILVACLSSETGPDPKAEEASRREVELA